jgi:hypothetical protein
MLVVILTYKHTNVIAHGRAMQDCFGDKLSFGVCTYSPWGTRARVRLGEDINRHRMSREKPSRIPTKREKTHLIDTLKNRTARL